MPLTTVNLPPQNCRVDAAEQINHAMARFPLILQILAELAKSNPPLPGDEDIRHGCERALTRILSDLARIDPAAVGSSSKAEEIASSWLRDGQPLKLVDADRLERIQQLIDSILPAPHAARLAR